MNPEGSLVVEAKGMPATEAVTDELWYKDAIIYQLHVKAFADSNNDGIGDFAGLTEKLGYLQDLGVTTLWLLPFYPSPGRDDGYDIADYGDINPDFGTMKISAASSRKPRSAACGSSPSSSSTTRPTSTTGSSAPAARTRIQAPQLVCLERHRPEVSGTRIIFTDTEKSNWTWDPEASSTGTASSRTSRTSISTIRAW